MRTKIYSLSFLFLLLFVSVAWSQVRLWTTTNGLSYMDLDGLNHTHASDFTPHSVLGKSTSYYLQDGLYVCGINTEGGEQNQKTGAVSPDRKGTIFKLNGSGMVQLHQFRAGIDDPAGTTLFIGGDDHVYYVGPYYTVAGNKQYQIGRAGGTSSRILVYGFKPNELLSSHSYVSHPGTYGTSQTGGSNSAGFFYRVNATYTGIEVKYHFRKETGSHPVGKLARGVDGYLYGVTRSGGRHNYGVIFKIHPTGSNYQVLHHFNKNDGAYPDRGLVTDYDGFLYGVTSKGGTYNRGVIFAIYWEGGLHLLHSFNTDGAPDATYKIEQNLMIAQDRLLIGKNSSTIYSIAKDGSASLRVLHRTSANAMVLSSGAYPDLQLKYPPDGAMNVPVNGTFRPDTLDGALNYTLQLSTREDFGSLAQTIQSPGPSFQVQGLKPGTKYYARYKASFWPNYGNQSSFTTHISTTDGESVVTTPSNGAINAEAPSLKVTVKAVTGATRYTVELSTSPNFGTVKSVTSAQDHQRTLTFTGLLYSTTYYARVKTNVNSAYGAVTSFRTKPQSFSKVTMPTNGAAEIEFSVLKMSAEPITQAKRYTVEVNTNSTFTGEKLVYSSLTDGQNSFVIRKLNPATTYYARVKTDVNTTWGPVTKFSTRERLPFTRVWGITGGSDYAGGTIFSFSVDSMKFTKHVQLSAAHGFGTDLIAGPDGFYGAQHNSPYEEGFEYNLFRYEPITGSLIHSLPFSYSDEGARVMMASNGQLYATVESWWTAGKLVRMSQDLRTFKEFHFFRDGTGRDPKARVIEVDGWFYGTTHVGGRTGWGTIYRIRPDGSNFTVLHEFNYNDGFFARGLAYGNDGWIYGTTSEGPLDNTGIVYRIRTDGSIYEVLHVFSDEGPTYPEGNIIVEDGVIYGVTSYSSAGGGTIFRMRTDGAEFVVIHQFNSTSGYAPNGDLALGRDGYLYGTTFAGGSHGRGVLFRLRQDGAVFQKLFDFSDETGPLPLSSVVVTDDRFQPVSAVMTTSAVARVEVYPNPTAESFNVTRSATTTGSVHIELTDFSGNVVHKSILEQERLELGRALPKGMYILKVIHDDKVTTHRLLKR